MVKCIKDVTVVLIFGVTVSLVYGLIDEWVDVNPCDGYIVQLCLEMAIVYNRYVVQWMCGVMMSWCMMLGMCTLMV